MKEKRVLFCLPNIVFSTNEENSPAALQEVYFLPHQFRFSFYTVHRAGVLTAIYFSFATYAEYIRKHFGGVISL